MVELEMRREIENKIHINYNYDLWTEFYSFRFFLLSFFCLYRLWPASMYYWMDTQHGTTSSNAFNLKLYNPTYHFLTINTTTEQNKQQISTVRIPFDCAIAREGY